MDGNLVSRSDFDPHNDFVPFRGRGAFPVASWRRANRCGPNGGNCVEVNLGAPGAVGVRDSKRGDGPALVFPRPRWADFLAAAARAR